MEIELSLKRAEIQINDDIVDGLILNFVHGYCETWFDVVGIVANLELFCSSCCFYRNVFPSFDDPNGDDNLAFYDNHFIEKRWICLQNWNDDVVGRMFQHDVRTDFIYESLADSDRIVSFIENDGFIDRFSSIGQTETWFYIFD